MIRPDRMASVFFFWPLTRLMNLGAEPKVPILMYHSVSNNLFGKSHPYYQINTSPKLFEQQMRALRDAGYQTVDPGDCAGDALRKQAGQKIVSITFDDGYRDFYTDAFAVLRKFGFTATIYLATSRIKNSAEVYEGVEYLSWNEVREMRAAGIQFGSHTVTHPDMRSLSPEQIEYELGCSKETLESQLGERVTSFAYPYAFPEEDKNFVRYLRDALENQGYENGVTTILGRATAHCDPLFLPRLPANSWDDPSFFRAKLEGGYDWLHWPQWLYKTMHHHVTQMQQASQVEHREAE